MSDSLETYRSSHVTADAEESVAAAGGARVATLEEKFGFLKFQKNRRNRSRDIVRYVP